MDLTLIIPCYNEAGRLPGTLARSLSYLEHSPFMKWEVLIVDDGSRDGTSEVVQRLYQGNQSVRISRYEDNRGKGYAVKHGLGLARGEVVVFMDADGSIPLEDVARVVEALAEADIAIGSRNLPESQVPIPQPSWRRFLGIVFDKLVKAFILRMDVKDITCGFKGFRRKAASVVRQGLTLDRWCFDVEILAIARAQRLRVKEIPVTWRDSRSTRVRFPRDIFMSLLEMLNIKINQWRGRYG